MVFTDPPYNVSYRAPGSGVTIANDNLGVGFGAFLQHACAHMLNNTRGALYLHLSQKHLQAVSTPLDRICVVKPRCTDPALAEALPARMSRPTIEVADIVRQSGNQFIDRYRQKLSYQQMDLGTLFYVDLPARLT